MTVLLLVRLVIYVCNSPVRWEIRHLGISYKAYREEEGKW